MSHADTKTTFKGSVWIRPTGAAMDRLQEAIRYLHSRVGGPPVKAHVSLLGGLDLPPEDAQARLRGLVSRLKPFEIRLGRIEWRPEYYRCLFVAVEPSEQLLAAHVAAHEAFERPLPDTFEPHVSLLYGDIEESLKKQLASELGGAVETEFIAAAVDLVNATEKVPIAQWSTFKAAKIG